MTADDDIEAADQPTVAAESDATTIETNCLTKGRQCWLLARMMSKQRPSLGPSTVLSTPWLVSFDSCAAARARIA